MVICKRCGFEKDKPKYEKAVKQYKKKIKLKRKNIKQVFQSIGDGIEGKGY